MIRIGLIAAAAMLAGGIGVAAAQTSTTPSTAATQGKCWDSATNQVRDKATTGTTAATGSTGMTGSTSITGSGTTGSGTTGTTSTSPGAGAPNGAGTTAARPPEAVGLPNC